MVRHPPTGAPHPGSEGNAFRSAEAKIGGLQHLREWSADDLIVAARGIGRLLAERRDFSTAKIRSVLEGVNRVHIDAQRGGFQRDGVRFLEVRLAYAAGREGNRALRDLQTNLYNVVATAINKIETVEDFERLRQFVQGIVAFHRFYGGGE